MVPNGNWRADVIAGIRAIPWNGCSGFRITHASGQDDQHYRKHRKNTELIDGLHNSSTATAFLLPLKPSPFCNLIPCADARVKFAAVRLTLHDVTSGICPRSMLNTDNRIKFRRAGTSIGFNAIRQNSSKRTKVRAPELSANIILTSSCVKRRQAVFPRNRQTSRVSF